MKRESNTFTAKEISVLLNNALAVASKPDSGLIDEKRLRKCRAVSQAMLEPLEDLVNGGISDEDGKRFPPCLRAEELVCILIAGALFIQQQMILSEIDLPQARISDLLFKKIYD